VKEALLAREDTRFYVHRGIDWIGLGRAAASILSGGAIQGGSTLTQQLVKNLVIGNARTGLDGVMRKVREALIARRVERVMTKDEILAAYLNQMDFGSTASSPAFGIVQAAYKYFGRSANDLNLYEAAILVGALRGTTLYNPVTSPDAADRQARAILEKMLDQRRISLDAYFRALREGVRPRPEERAAAPAAVATGYYVAWSRAEFMAIVGAQIDDSRRGVMRFVVGLDPWLQEQGSVTIREQLARNGRRHVGQGALVAIYSDGRVAALVGGADFSVSQFDHATQARRQPGSAFKPIVYAAAFNAGLRPDTIRLDGPVTLNGYAPRNSDRRFFGPIPLTTAFAQSRNTVAVQLCNEIGPGAIATLAYELGIRSQLRPDTTLALGTSEVTLLELTAAYVPFMNDGRSVRPYAARMALNARGEVIFRRDPAPRRPVLSAVTREAMRGMLHMAVTDGTGRQAQLRDRWSAGKTGTTQDNRDAWFVGFTDTMATGVWFGNDDNTPMTDVWGAGLPALAWRAFNVAANAPPSETHAAAAGPYLGRAAPQRRPVVFAARQLSWRKR
jgi:penicillin-binding protein 1A